MTAFFDGIVKKAVVLTFIHKKIGTKTNSAMAAETNFFIRYAAQLHFISRPSPRYFSYFIVVFGTGAGCGSTAAGGEAVDLVPV